MKKTMESLLAQKKAAILERWRDLIFSTYPGDGANFFKGEKDKFANPVGSIILEGTEGIFSEFTGSKNAGLLAGHLDSIIRVRAVQDFSPSEALAFVPLLKRAIREELNAEIKKDFLFSELMELESGIDDMMLLGIDIYMKCREQVYEIRCREAGAQRDAAIKLLTRTAPEDKTE